MEQSGTDWGAQVIDPDGYRANVGIILTNRSGEVLWARRVGQNAWQFPQGGILRDETPEQAVFRELNEEIGLAPGDVEVIGCTRGWLRYRLPRRLVRYDRKPVCIGQKQRWFLLRLVGEESNVRLDTTDTPEFDAWRWVSYWQPLEEIVFFKRKVYERALRELEPLLFGRRPRDLPVERRGAVLK
jgi:putative (di)nucleoside polyphosphate hydrolase